MKKSKRKKQKPFSLGFAGLWTVTRLGLLLLLMSLTACAAKKIVLHPIEGTDIVPLKQGDSLTAPKQGFFLSDAYVSDVMKAKVE